MRLPKRFLLVLLFGSLALPAAVLAQVKDFTDQTLTGKDFKGASLAGADFSDATLENCNFNGASLKGAHFKDTVVKGTVIEDADLTGADLRGISGQLFLSGSNLGKVNLEGTDCKRLDLFRTVFKEANLRNTKNWSQVTNCDFYKADLRGANLRGAYTIHGKTLAEVRFKGALYDETTSWPDGFDPVAAGCVLSKATPAGTP